MYCIDAGTAATDDDASNICACIVIVVATAGYSYWAVVADGAVHSIVAGCLVGKQGRLSMLSMA